MWATRQSRRGDEDSGELQVDEGWALAVGEELEQFICHCQIGSLFAHNQEDGARPKKPLWRAAHKTPQNSYREHRKLSSICSMQLHV